MTFNDLIDKSITYFEDNEDELGETLRSIGLTAFGGWEPMSELQVDYGFDSPLEVMALALDSYRENHFDPDDDFYRKTDDGTLESDSYVDYTEYIDADLITEIYNERDNPNIVLPKYIERLFEAFLADYDNDDEDEEEEI